MMACKKFMIFMVLLSLPHALVVDCHENRQRIAKIFSLLNVVRFENEACLSGLDDNRSGTCMTMMECLQNDGIVSGACAAGFGTCCVFSTSQCGSVINKNCSYVQNDNFPSAVFTRPTSPCSFSISRSSFDICILRLDFESLTLAGPSGSLELTGGSCETDSFRVTNPDSSVPTICGENSGQHVYLSFGAEDTVGITFTFGQVDVFRRWRLKITHLECFDNNRPPDGCLQYFTSPAGRITTFNFFSGISDTHLANQRYSTCIRSRPGFCCVRYSTCQDQELSFSLNNLDAMGSSGRDNACVEDFVIIDGGSTQCQRNDMTRKSFFSNRFCGRTFNVLSSQLKDGFVCDCSPPFVLGIRTDDGQAAVPAATRDRGICLDYTLIRC